MKNLATYLSGAPIILLCSGCGLMGGQSFDDGSGDLGRGRRDHFDGRGPLDVLSGRPSVRIVEHPASADRNTSPDFALFAGDLDADGRSDLVIQNSLLGSALLAVFYGRAYFPARLGLEDADVIIQGIQGPPVAPLGDFNGDGFDDIAIGGDEPRLLLGGAERLSGTVDVASIAAALPADYPDGWSVATGPGDVNGDGFADLLLMSSESSRLFLGSSFAPGASLSGVRGVTLESGYAEHRDDPHRGPPVDLDGDGMSDIVIVDQEGTSFYYGRSDWNDTSGTLEPDAEYRGWVRRMGDWDGDGYGDLAQVIDRRQLGEHGEIVSLEHDLLFSYGEQQRLSGVVELSRPPSDGTYSLRAQLSAGDTNGDGLLDLVLGSPQNPMGAIDAGRERRYPGGVFFLAGAAGPRTDQVRLDADSAALQGRSGRDADWLGSAIAANGDANGDGYQDILMMSTKASDDSLEVRLIFGGEDL